jgi:hypothetical protein
MTGDVSAQLEAEAQVASVRVMHKPVRPRVLQLGLIDLLEGGRHPNKSEAASPLDGRD